METPEVMPLEWHVEKRKLCDLVPLEHNPFGILTDEKRERLRGKITRLGIFETAAVDTENNLLTFNKRFHILSQLRSLESEIEVKVPNRVLTQEEREEVIFSSNIHEGQWDREIIELAYATVDLEALGLDLSVMAMPTQLANDMDPEEEHDFEPEPPVEPVTKLGDLYEFESQGKAITHRLACGDSTDRVAFAKLMNGQLANLVVTDPPYNVDYQGKTKDALKIENDKMSNDSFYQFLFDYYTVHFEHMHPGAPIYVFHADSEGANFRSALKAAKLKLSQCLVWVKQSFVMGRQDYHWKHEPILYGWKEGAAHTWYSDRSQSTVLQFDRPSRNAEHPTMKPIDILSYLVSNSSKRYDLVIDGCGGSGTLLITAEQLYRTCYLQELDPKYCDVIVWRWVKYMRDNGLAFTVTKNGEEINELELAKYQPSAKPEAAVAP